MARICRPWRDYFVPLQKPYHCIIETADHDSVNCAPFLVRQTTLPAGSDELHPLFRAADSVVHDKPPCGSECSE